MRIDFENDLNAFMGKSKIGPNQYPRKVKKKPDGAVYVCVTPLKIY